MITDRIGLHSVLLPLQIKNIKLWYKFHCALPENIHTCPPPPHTHTEGNFLMTPSPLDFPKSAYPSVANPLEILSFLEEIKSMLFVSDTESLS